MKPFAISIGAFLLACIFLINTASAGDSAVFNGGASSVYKKVPSGPVLKYGEVHYCFSALPLIEERTFLIHHLLEEEEEYEETPFRRFEIVFIISTPLTLALSFAGLTVYKAAAGTLGNYSTIDYTYLTFSTLSLSLSVALHDYRVVYKKRGT